jgi:hypothetical protein
MNEVKIGLIIQGPIISTGLSGSTYALGKFNSKTNNLVTIDTNPYILSNLIEANKLFDQIVVTTWSREHSHISPEVMKQNTVLCEDPDPEPIIIGNEIKGFPDYNKLNQIRHFFLIRQGLKFLKDYGVTHAIKIRTDQKMDIELLYEEFKRFATNNLKKVFVPYYFADDSDRVPDMYLGAEINYFLKISNLMADKQFKFNLSPHRDLFYKALFLENYWENRIMYGDFFADKKNKSERKKIIVKFCKDTIFWSGSEQLYSSLIWRGSKIEISKREKFEEIHSESRLLPNLSLESIDYDKFLSSTLGCKTLYIFLQRYAKFKLHNYFKIVKSAIYTNGVLRNFKKYTNFLRLR